MKVLLFGRLADKIGGEVELALPEEGCTIAELRARLCDEKPELGDEFARSTVKACIDRQLAHDDDRVSAGQEIAFIPPVSGG